MRKIRMNLNIILNQVFSLIGYLYSVRKVMKEKYFFKIIHHKNHTKLLTEELPFFFNFLIINFLMILKTH